MHCESRIFIIATRPDSIPGPAQKYRQIQTSCTLGVDSLFLHSRVSWYRPPNPRSTEFRLATIFVLLAANRVFSGLNSALNYAFICHVPGVVPPTSICVLLRSTASFFSPFCRLNSLYYLRSAFSPPSRCMLCYWSTLASSCLFLFAFLNNKVALISELLICYLV